MAMLLIQCNPYQNCNSIFQRNSTNNPKICMEPQKTQIAKVIWRKKNKAGGIMLSDFKLYYKSILIIRVWYWCKNRCIDTMEQNREPRNRSMHYQGVQHFGVSEPHRRVVLSHTLNTQTLTKTKNLIMFSVNIQFCVGACS